eukprot:15163705-Alexandrium_andersonii.AAC.1
MLGASKATLGRPPRPRREILGACHGNPRATMGFSRAAAAGCPKAPCRPLRDPMGLSLIHI